MTPAAVHLAVLERRLDTASSWVRERLAFQLAQLRERVELERAAETLTVLPPARRALRSA